MLHNAPVGATGRRGGAHAVDHPHVLLATENGTGLFLGRFLSRTSRSPLSVLNRSASSSPTSAAAPVDEACSPGPGVVPSGPSSSTHRRAGPQPRSYAALPTPPRSAHGSPPGVRDRQPVHERRQVPVLPRADDRMPLARHDAIPCSTTAASRFPDNHLPARGPDLPCSVVGRWPRWTTVYYKRATTCWARSSWPDRSLSNSTANLCSSVSICGFKSFGLWPPATLDARRVLRLKGLWRVVGTAGPYGHRLSSAAGGGKKGAGMLEGAACGPSNELLTLAAASAGHRRCRSPRPSRRQGVRVVSRGANPTVAKCAFLTDTTG